MTSKTVIKLTIGLLMIHTTAKYFTLNQILIYELTNISMIKYKDFDLEYQKY